MLALLTVIAVFNYVDRVVLGILLEAIKVDLQLTDTELGFLGGVGFALFYSLMGVPISRWADRGNRVTIISLTAALWSTAVALCGMAGSFMQLLMIRIGVAVGEAGCIPPAFSLIADYFNRAERPRAAAIYGLGGPIACAIGFFLGGWLNELYGWRVTFMLLSAPGLALAGLAWFTLKEPRCAVPLNPRSASVAQLGMREVIVTLWTNVTFRHLLLSLSVNFLFTYGMLQWQPAFFVRSYALTTGEVGMWFALIYGVAGIVGSYAGGEWASRYAAQNERLQLTAMAIAVAASGILSVFVYLPSNLPLALGMLMLVSIGLNAVNGPLFSTIQTLVPERMRAVSFALVYLVANLVGMGLGPLATGVLSDLLRPWAGDESLRYALLLLGPAFIWSAWHLRQASKTVARDLTLANGFSAPLRGSLLRPTSS